MTSHGATSALRVLPDRHALMNAAALRVEEASRQAIADHGRFTWVLSGGSTPRELYELLGSAGFADRIEWSKVEFFWSDERCVPPNHAQSNYGMVRKALLEKIYPGAGRIHRMLGESEPTAAALDYEEELRRAFPLEQHMRDRLPPQFDLILLGMGEDGHTASLFPGHPALLEVSRWVVPAQNAPDGPWRITLTLPVLNAASEVIFLVSGASKRERLAEVLRTPATLSAVTKPAGRVRPQSGHLLWLVDTDAAASIEPRRS